ncbi:TetR/AcrR family transcriptional regulator [Mammaliicoccus sciuri]|uniref:Transcriptional regulator, TetR family n=2 Tax=Sporosarcina newyorkensis TaxID=759851 RepID=A0A1T4XPL2_9BACL|nr:TetR/AcrR family transcriptional regulator [Sporosarcina newyorkensis]EGQ22484.1 transcriptional regulator [Sporosarcina newyorkensis 2681]SKA91061.1 transcriptional regulator, TetR family [Sporosarcina newyorkensis]
MSLRQKKIAKKKEDILRTAVSILAEKGYQGTTMEEIASSLLMTKGSVYYYFKDKQDLLYQSQLMLLQQSLINIKTIQQENLPVVDRFKKAMVAHITYLLDEKSGFEMMVKLEQIFSTEQLEEIFQLRNDYEKCFDQLILEGINDEVFETVEITIVRNTILGAMNWVTQWYSPEGKKDATEIAETVSDYLSRILVIK